MSPSGARVLVLERDPHGRGFAKALECEGRFVTHSVSALADVDAAVQVFKPELLVVVGSIDDRETKANVESVIATFRLPTVLAAGSAKQLATLRQDALARGVVAAETVEALLARGDAGEANRGRLRLLARAGPVIAKRAAEKAEARTDAKHRTGVSRSWLTHPGDPLPVVGIVASTGGPDTLPEILAALPRPFPLPITLVQHLADGFADTFAGWLGQVSRRLVKIPEDGETLLPGVIYLAPDRCHLCVTARGQAMRDTTTGDVNGHIPAGNVLLRSIARSHGARAIGVVLTGMGVDGADGLYSMFMAGAATIAQDSATSIVDGMPARARALGAARQVLPKERVAEAIAAVASTLIRGDGPERRS